MGIWVRVTGSGEWVGIPVSPGVLFGGLFAFILLWDVSMQAGILPPLLKADEECHGGGSLVLCLGPLV